MIIGHGWVANKMAARLNMPQISHEHAADYINAVVPRPHIKWVINCAGLTGTPNVDWCETHRVETLKANTVFPLKIAHLCEQFGFRFMHFSSGCIFQGGPHSEESEPNFTGSVYSLSKSISDEALKDKALVLRIRMPFDGSGHPKCLFTKLQKYSKLLDGYNSLSEINEMCDIAARLVREDALNGVYHLVNKGAIWTHDIAKMLNLDKPWWGPEFSDYFPAPRSVCELTTKLETTPIHEAIERTLYQYA